MDDTTALATLTGLGQLNRAWLPGDGVRLGTPDFGPVDFNGGWYRAADLAGDPELARAAITRHAAARGIPFGRHAASLLFQRWSHRIAGITIGLWVETGTVFDLSADRVTVRCDQGSPAVVWLDDLVPVTPDGSADEVLAVLVDGHLLPLAHSWRFVSGVGLPNLWGNMAAAMAGALRTLSRRHDAERLLHIGEELLGRRRELSRGGEFRVLHGARGGRLFYDRRSCCHWYAVPDGKFCSWCSRIDQAERTERFRQILDDEPGPAEPSFSTIATKAVLS